MSRLSRNILYNFLGQGLLLLLGLVAVKYVFRQLGEDALGIIFFAAALSAILSGVLEMGLGATTVREISAHASDEPLYIASLLRTGSLFYWGAYLVVAVAVYFLVPLLVTKWINLRTLDPSAATLVLRILGIAALTALPRAFYTSILRGLQRMEFNNLIDVTTSAFQQLGTIVILVLGGGLMHVAYWFGACFALGIAAYFMISAHFFSFRALVPGYSSAVVKRNFRYASRMASISILAMAHMQSDKAIVSKLLPLGEMGYYGLAYSAISRSTLLTSAIAQAAFPSFSALFKKGDRLPLLVQYRKLQDLLCFGTVPFFAAIAFAAVPVFTYFLSAGAARLLLWPVAFLCVGFYMNGTLNVPYVFSLAVGRPDIAARLNFYALFCVLPVTFILVHLFGLAGAGFSWVFYHLFAYAYAVPRLCSQCLGIPTWSWYVHVSKALILAALTYGLAWVVLVITVARSNILLMVAYALASMLFLAGAYLMVGEELRETITRLPQTLMAKSAEAS
jgi:O-antigen/teichoic acid export membrane protein